MLNAKTTRYIGGAILLALATGAYASVDAGRVEFVFGNSRALAPNGVERILKKGDVVYQGDTVITGPSASLQLLMVDHAMLAIRPNSKLRIDTYRFKGKEDGSELGILRLIKGTFRSITGMIGHTNKKNYRIITETANIGVRGTDHEAGYLLPGQTEGAPGTYDKVNWGGTYIKTPWGSVDVSPNEVGFASSKPGSVPVLLQGVPGFLQQAAPPMSKDADASGSDQPERVVGKDADNPASLERPWLNSRALSHLHEPGVVKTDLTLNDVNFNVAGVYGDAETGSVYNGAFDANEMPFAKFMSNTAKALAATDPTSKLIYTRGTVPTVKQGSYAFEDGGPVVNWGIYGTGSAVPSHMVKDRNTAKNRNPDYMQIMGAAAAPDAVVNQLSATYSKVVAFTPVISTTSTGSTVDLNSSLSATIQIGSTKTTIGPQLLAYTVAATSPAAGGTFTGSCSACGALSDFSTKGVALSGTGPSSTSTSGSAYGQVVGSSGQGVISSYTLTNGTTSVTGSFAVGKD